LTLVLNIINGIQQHSNFRGKSKIHISACSSFAKIYHDIQEQLSISVPLREVDREFLHNKIVEYDNLIINLPEIRKVTRDKYLSAIQDKSIFKSHMVEDIEDIDINLSNPTQSANTGESEDEPDSKDKFEIDRFIRNF
jgi:hypothetical protein